MMNRVILGLGSNQQENENMIRATDALKNIFPGILFSDVVYTKPVGLITENLFLNRVGIAYLPCDIPEINKELKRIERELGCLPYDK